MTNRAEKVAPLLKEAVAARIRVHELVAQIEELLAGPKFLECRRQLIETGVADYIDDLAVDQTAEGIGVADAEVMFEELEIAP
jgi:hypothetical protein